MGKNNPVRDYYYKAKNAPSISRGKDGLFDPDYLASTANCPVHLHEVIDQLRSDPEDYYSMFNQIESRNMEDVNHGNVDRFAHNRENMAYKAYHIVDSKQCRALI